MNHVYIQNSVYFRRSTKVYVKSAFSGLREFEKWELYLLVCRGIASMDQVRLLLDLFK